jgi:putative flippase GtrA
LNHASLRKDGLRFLAAGLANTGLTFLVYQLLLFVVSAQLAYVVAWCAGLLFVVAVYPSKVFAGGRTDWRARVNLGISYVGVFLVGLLTLKLLGTWSVAPRIAIVFVMGVTTVTNFIVGRLLVRPVRA